MSVQNDRIDGDAEFVETYAQDEVDDKGNRIRVQRSRYKVPLLSKFECFLSPRGSSAMHVAPVACGRWHRAKVCACMRPPGSLNEARLFLAAVLPRGAWRCGVLDGGWCAE